MAPALQILNSSCGLRKLRRMPPQPNFAFSLQNSTLLELMNHGPIFGSKTNGFTTDPRPWFINCVGTIQIVTLWYIGSPKLNSRLGFINPGLTLYIHVPNNSTITLQYVVCVVLERLNGDRVASLYLATSSHKGRKFWGFKDSKVAKCQASKIVKSWEIGVRLQQREVRMDMFIYYMYKHTHIYIYIYYTHKSVYINKCIYIYIYIYIYKYIYIYILIYIYIYIIIFIYLEIIHTYL